MVLDVSSTIGYCGECGASVRQSFCRQNLPRLEEFPCKQMLLAFLGFVFDDSGNSIDG